MSEPQIRLAIFVGLFVLLAVMEVLAPRREPKPVKASRWLTNIAIVAIDSLVVRLIFKSAAVGGALWAAENGIGLFNMVAVPTVLAIVLSFVVLDFAVWLAHVASHKIPLLWRIHRMHHTDVDFDLTTAVRFHPFEIVLSMAWKYLFVLALGAPAVAVLVFEIVLNGAAMFNHSNWRLPLWLDAVLRKVIVTPDMHRIHHSIDRHETDSNYGFNLSIWDQMFGTYVPEPVLGQEDMKIGLPECQDVRPTKIGWTLMVPFRSLSSEEAERKIL
jgi:sterol desaturase/sphingolipid hydroxylase (fatty acid hydroxylase superfamily)